MPSGAGAAMSGMRERLLTCEQCGETIWPGDAAMATTEQHDDQGEPIEGSEQWHHVHNGCLDRWKAERGAET